MKLFIGSCVAIGEWWYGSDVLAGVWEYLVVCELHLKGIVLNLVGIMPLDSEIVQSHMENDIGHIRWVIDRRHIVYRLFSRVSVFTNDCVFRLEKDCEEVSDSLF